MKKFFGCLVLCAMMLSMPAVFMGCDSSSKDSVSESESESDVLDEPDESSSEEEKTTATEKETECSHKWKEADCLNPKTCTVCGETVGSAAGHSWKDADCENPKTCTVCGETMGSALGHDWMDADCENPQTCRNCGETVGAALGHVWIDATYDAPQTCSVCGKTTGSPLERPAMNVNISTPLPQEFSYYRYSGEVRDTVLITEVYCTYEEYRYADNEYELTLYFTGEKTYDIDGSGQGRSCSIGIKVYDEEGYVVADDTFYTSSLRVGEKFRDEECSMWTDRLPAGNYTIELSSTN